MTTEASMWKWLSKDPIPNVCLERHENLVGVGAPDVWGYHREHGSFWLELKQSEGPKDSSKKTGIKVRNSQRIWFRKMSKLDCRKHWFLIQVCKRRYLVPGRVSTIVAEMSENNLGQFEVTNLPAYKIVAIAAKGF